MGSMDEKLNYKYNGIIDWEERLWDIARDNKNRGNSNCLAIMRAASYINTFQSFEQLIELQNGNILVGVFGGRLLAYESINGKYIFAYNFGKSKTLDQYKDKDGNVDYEKLYEEINNS